MAFVQKTWVNRDNASPTDPRIEANELNRIEDGITEALTQSADDIATTTASGNPSTVEGEIRTIRTDITDLDTKIDGVDTKLDSNTDELNSKINATNATVGTLDTKANGKGDTLIADGKNLSLSSAQSGILSTVSLDGISNVVLDGDNIDTIVGVGFYTLLNPVGTLPVTDKQLGLQVIASGNPSASKSVTQILYVNGVNNSPQYNSRIFTRTVYPDTTYGSTTNWVQITNQEGGGGGGGGSSILQNHVIILNRGNTAPEIPTGSIETIPFNSPSSSGSLNEPGNKFEYVAPGKVRILSDDVTAIKVFGNITNSNTSAPNSNGGNVYDVICTAPDGGTNLLTIVYTPCVQGVGETAVIFAIQRSSYYLQKGGTIEIRGRANARPISTSNTSKFYVEDISDVEIGAGGSGTGSGAIIFESTSPSGTQGTITCTSPISEFEYVEVFYRSSYDVDNIADNSIKVIPTDSDKLFMYAPAIVTNGVVAITNRYSINGTTLTLDLARVASITSSGVTTSDTDYISIFRIVGY